MTTSKRRKKRSYTGWVEDFPIFIWANDGETPSEYLQSSDIYKEPFHGQMKRVRITVEEIQ